MLCVRLQPTSSTSDVDFDLCIIVAVSLFIIRMWQCYNLVSVFTVRLHVMQRTVLLSEFCLSVRLSVLRQMRVL